MKNYKELPLRMGVGIALINHEKKVFVGKRIDNPKNFWQMPQGGIDKNENYLEAAKRELAEETSVTNVKIVKELDDWLSYDLPENLLGKIWQGRYKGQKQKWFIMKFTGQDEEINIKTNHPEFLDWKWIRSSKLPNIAVSFKINIYKKLKKQLNLLNLN